jgi:hypothetical protein
MMQAWADYLDEEMLRKGARRAATPMFTLGPIYIQDSHRIRAMIPCVFRIR